MITNKELYLKNKKLLQWVEENNKKQEQQDKLMVGIFLVSIPSLLLISSLILIIFV